MRINTKSDFKFNASVSTTHYEGKCNEWGKLRYQTKEVTIDELGDYITEGYCFTHTFKEVSADGTFGCKEKTIKNFKSTNAIFLDIDDSSITAEDFYSTISPQPTILYTTPSNITGEKNRYRLVYIFEDLKAFRLPLMKIQKHHCNHTNKGPFLFAGLSIPYGNYFQNCDAFQCLF